MDSSQVLFCTVCTVFEVKFYLVDNRFLDFTVWKVLQNSVSRPSYWSKKCLSCSRQSSSKLLEELSISWRSALEFLWVFLEIACICEEINILPITSFFLRPNSLEATSGATYILNQSEVYDFLSMLLTFIWHWPKMCGINWSGFFEWSMSFFAAFCKDILGDFESKR